MRVAKKILYWFMALFPILSLVLPLPMTFQAMRTESEAMGETALTFLSVFSYKGNYSVYEENDSLLVIDFQPGFCTVVSESVFDVSADYQKPFQQTVLKLAYAIEQNVGYSMEIFLAVFACMYHLFIMYIVEFLMALICFIPKKCSELFGG